MWYCRQQKVGAVSEEIFADWKGCLWGFASDLIADRSADRRYGTTYGQILGLSSEGDFVAEAVQWQFKEYAGLSCKDH